MNLLVIDGNSLMNRAFYGIRLLSNKNGQYTNAIYGFMNMLSSLKNEYKPDCFAVAFDLKAPTFRHEMYEKYKAGRKGMPEELAEQMPKIKELLKYLGIKALEMEGFEADDILGTLSHQSNKDNHCFIATGDRDSLQLVSDTSTVLLATTKFGWICYTPEKIMQEYGVTPIQMIDIKGLMGDASDNIPGVAGIGEKTACALIQANESIEKIYENIESIKITDNVRNKLIAGKDSAFISKQLGTVKTDMDIVTDYSHYSLEKADESLAVKLLVELEMFSLIERLGLNINSSAIARDEENEKEKVTLSEKSFDDIMKGMKQEKKAFFACEFNGTELEKIAFAFEKEACIFEKNQVGFDSFIADLFKNEDIEKHTCDIKKLYRYALSHNITLNNAQMDVVLAGYVLNPSSTDYSPKRLAGEHGISVPESDSEDDLIATSLAIRRLSDYLMDKMKEDEQIELYLSIELPLAKVLAFMEHEGFKVDKEGIKSYGDMLEEKINELTTQIYELSGCEFNIKSPKQLGEVLFDKMGLPVVKKTKSGYSTNAEVLESLINNHPIISLILEYRTFTKLKSTYCDGLIKEIAPDGRIHSTLNQTETRTGRISSTEPNLQNIPVRTDYGRELRKYFVADDGNVLVDADYSQIELRVLAAVSDDEEMIRAFNDGEDIHAITASQVFNIPFQMVTPLMRRRAKAVNFGIVYGIGAFSLAKDIGVTRKEADQYIKGYLNHYIGVKNYLENSVEQAKNNGYALTLFNRRRYLPELKAKNAMLRSFGERVAMNMPIQGTAADIIKIAMIKVFERIERENLKAKLILQVHDELIVESPIEEEQQVTQIVKEEMENACTLKVKLLADVHCGKTWYDAKD